MSTYLDPKETKENKDQVTKALYEQYASPIIKSGTALSLAFKYITKNDQILDCGPGTGIFLQCLYKKGYQDLYAVDLDKYFEDDSCIKELKLADLSFDRIPWGDNHFDAITSWQTVEHLENPFHFVREVKRVLKPGGVFIMSIPNIQHIFNRLFFFRKGDMVRYHKKNNHIAMFPRGVFTKTFLKHFDLVEETYTEGEFPWRFISKFKFPSNKRFGRDVIYVFVNNKK
jgi:2-polyprenyl-3-methyl-5-hydroxy-6-metoxy-1,4-benzoquinol methylase